MNCPKGMIKRKSYRKKTYTKKNGTKVKTSVVKSSCIKDRGSQGKNMSGIQSILFDNKKWSTARATTWLKNHNIKPIKQVHKTTNKLRYRISKPENYKRFRIKKVSKDIELIIGFKK